MKRERERGEGEVLSSEEFVLQRGQGGRLVGESGRSRCWGGHRRSSDWQASQSRTGKEEGKEGRKLELAVC